MPEDFRIAFAKSTVALDGNFGYTWQCQINNICFVTWCDVMDLEYRRGRRDWRATHPVIKMKDIELKEHQP
jgi:hypothetical protein